MNRIRNHRDAEIYVNDNGMFYTKDDCEYGPLEDNTLDGLKKKIDAAGASENGPEKAFVLEDGYSSGYKIVPVKCGRIIKTKYGQDVWITEIESKSCSKRCAKFVYHDTPANRAKAEQYIAQQKALEEKASERAGQIEETLVPITKTREES